MKLSLWSLIRNWLIFILLQFCIWLYWLVETDEESKGTDIMVLERKYWCLFLFFLMLYLWNCFLFTIFYCLWEFILKLGYTIHAENYWHLRLGIFTRKQVCFCTALNVCLNGIQLSFFSQDHSSGLSNKFWVLLNTFPCHCSLAALWDFKIWMMEYSD